MLVAPDERGHAGDQKTPQVLIAHLRDVTEPLLAAAGVVERRQAEPSRELTSRAEVGRVTDGGGERSCAEQAHAGHGRDASGQLAGSVPSQKLAFELTNAGLHLNCL